MKNVNSLFAYLSILAVIQPARIQDIESNAPEILGDELAEELSRKSLLRSAHDVARETGLVIQVRRGVYFIAPKARRVVHRAGLGRSIDNSRFFLMKAQRRRYK